jgi:galactokinase
VTEPAQLPPTELSTTFDAAFGAGATRIVRAPGRVNLIGEHIDYCGLPVLPMAIPESTWLLVRPREDAVVRLADCSPVFGPREFSLEREIPPGPAGDWGNYARAAGQALVGRFGALTGIDAAICSRIPAASGLSSSSAVVIAVGLALLDANRIDLPPEALATLLARGERYVGVQGGGMDQAISLGARAGTAARVSFDPLRLEYVRVPSDWRVIVASSLVGAKKSGPARRAYNQRPREAQEALAVVAARLGPLAAGTDYRRLLGEHGAERLVALGGDVLTPTLARRFRHVVTEAARVEAAVAAMISGDLAAFGALLSASHRSLRDDLEVSRPELDELVGIAEAAGAAGARLTGAGFGGCIIAVAEAGKEGAVHGALRERFYAPREVADTAPHLFTVLPSPGAELGPA